MRHINKVILGILAMALSVVGCNNDDLKDLNINPQAVNQIDLNYLFTAAELGIASGGSAGDNRYIDWRTNIGMAAYAIQQLGNAGGGIAPGDKYTHNFETSAAPFEFTYNDQLKNIAEILKQTGPGGFAEGKNQNTRNAARIIRAFSFQRLTDLYGSVPYSEANKGFEGKFFPAYDKQSVIYTDLLKELDEASSALDAANPDEGFAHADFIYDGDIAKWKKWGYSLMLRLAMRVSKRAPEMANTYVTKAVAGGVFTSNADNVWVKMALGPSEWTNQNGISRAFYPGDGGQPSFLSETLVDWLKGYRPDPGDDDATKAAKKAAALATTTDDDPRLMIISGGIADWSAAEWKPTNTDPLAQKGLPNGYDQGGLDALFGGTVDQGKTFSRINFLMLQDDDPYMIMNYAEVEFLLAEALQRGIGTGISGTAQKHYEDGVKAAMNQYTPFDASLTVSEAQANAYLAIHPYSANPQIALKMIYEELWTSKFFNWWEAWADWRRTGFPVLKATNYQGNVTNGTIPRRLQYPNAEVAGNQNYATGATKPDMYTTKVWWDGGED